jgi:hypothetical protein
MPPVFGHQWIGEKRAPASSGGRQERLTQHVQGDRLPSRAIGTARFALPIHWASASPFAGQSRRDSFGPIQVIASLAIQPPLRRGATAAVWANATGLDPVTRGLTTPRIAALRVAPVAWGWSVHVVGGMIAVAG